MGRPGLFRDRPSSDAGPSSTFARYRHYNRPCSCHADIAWDRRDGNASQEGEGFFFEASIINIKLTSGTFEALPSVDVWAQQISLISNYPAGWLLSFSCIFKSIINKTPLKTTPARRAQEFLGRFQNGLPGRAQRPPRGMKLRIATNSHGTKLDPLSFPHLRALRRCS